MNKKNLIISAITKYAINQIKPWVLSINEVTDKDSTDKVMILGDIASETRQWLIDNDFQVIDIYPPGSHKPLTSQWMIKTDLQLSNLRKHTKLPIQVARFYYMYEYLRREYKNYNYVLTADVKDVYFQTNPFQWLSSNLDDQFKLVASSESIKYKDEPWNNNNQRKTFGPYIHNLFKDNAVYNAGIIAGKAEYVKDLTFNIFVNAINRPTTLPDQAVYNILINTLPFKDIVKFARQCDGWACQAGASADPNVVTKVRPFLLEAEPVWKDGIVLTGQDGTKISKGTPFCMVHQWDRVPEWSNFIQNKYS